MSSQVFGTPVAEVCDVLQIPDSFSRKTDLLVAVAARPRVRI